MPYFPHFQTYWRMLVSDALHRDRGGFAAADAERGDTAFEILRFQRVQQRHDQPRAGGADGMAQRAGAAIDVELFTRNTEIALRRHGDDGKGFVDLEQIDVTNAPADLVEQFLDRRN